MDGELTPKDFFKYSVQHGYRPDNRIAKQNPVKLKRRASQGLINIRKGEPYIFFGEMKFLYRREALKMNGSGAITIIVDQYAYQFVAYNEYDGLKKTPKFCKLIYIPDYRVNKLPVQQWNNDNISKLKPVFCIENFSIKLILKDVLIQLKDFLDKKRDPKNSIFEKTTFCNTIYNEVVAELENIAQQPQQPQQQNNE